MMLIRNDNTSKLVNYIGEKPQPLPHIFMGHTDASDILGHLRFRNPNNFITWNFNLNFTERENEVAPKNVLNWIKNGADIEGFVTSLIRD